jgi:hypothetical protein
MTHREVAVFEFAGEFLKSISQGPYPLLAGLLFSVVWAQILKEEPGTIWEPV